MDKHTDGEKLILVVNDDGYQAQGIRHLAALMMRLGKVVVVAPSAARSGAACSITPTRPVQLKRICIDDKGIQWVSCDGTPVDCVKLAIEKVCSRMPDLVVSGINHGDNSSVSIHYSGTMGAAMEACIKGIPAIGYSLRTLSHQCDFRPFDEAILKIASHVLEQGLPQGVCLNVNFPLVERLRGIRVVRMSRGIWSGEWAEAHNPHGGEYYWLTGQFVNLEQESDDTDCRALDNGYASVVPIRLDMTDFSVLECLKKAMD